MDSEETSEGSAGRDHPRSHDEAHVYGEQFSASIRQMEVLTENIAKDELGEGVWSMESIRQCAAQLVSDVEDRLQTCERLQEDNSEMRRAESPPTPPTHLPNPIMPLYNLPLTPGCSQARNEPSERSSLVSEGKSEPGNEEFSDDRTSPTSYIPSPSNAYQDSEPALQSSQKPSSSSEQGTSLDLRVTTNVVADPHQIVNYAMERTASPTLTQNQITFDMDPMKLEPIMNTPKTSSTSVSEQDIQANVSGQKGLSDPKSGDEIAITTRNESQESVKETSTSYKVGDKSKQDLTLTSNLVKDKQVDFNFLDTVAGEITSDNVSMTTRSELQESISEILTSYSVEDRQKYLTLASNETKLEPVAGEKSDDNFAITTPNEIQESVDEIIVINSSAQDLTLTPNIVKDKRANVPFLDAGADAKSRTAPRSEIQESFDDKNVPYREIRRSEQKLTLKSNVVKDELINESYPKYLEKEKFGHRKEIQESFDDIKMPYRVTSSSEQNLMLKSNVIKDEQVNESDLKYLEKEKSGTTPQKEIQESVDENSMPYRVIRRSEQDLTLKSNVVKNEQANENGPKDLAEQKPCYDVAMKTQNDLQRSVHEICTSHRMEDRPEQYLKFASNLAKDNSADMKYLEEIVGEKSSHDIPMTTQNEIQGSVLEIHTLCGVENKSKQEPKFTSNVQKYKEVGDVEAVADEKSEMNTRREIQGSLDEIRTLGTVNNRSEQDHTLTPSVLKDKQASVSCVEPVPGEKSGEDMEVTPQNDLQESVTEIRLEEISEQDLTLTPHLVKDKQISVSGLGTVADAKYGDDIAMTTRKEIQESVDEISRLKIRLMELGNSLNKSAPDVDDVTLTEKKTSFIIESDDVEKKKSSLFDSPIESKVERFNAQVKETSQLSEKEDFTQYNVKESNDYFLHFDNVEPKETLLTGVKPRQVCFSSEQISENDDASNFMERESKVGKRHIDRKRRKTDGFVGSWRDVDDKLATASDDRLEVTRDDELATTRDDTNKSIADKIVMSKNEWETKMQRIAELDSATRVTISKLAERRERYRGRSISPARSRPPGPPTTRKFGQLSFDEISSRTEQLLGTTVTRPVEQPLVAMTSRQTERLLGMTTARLDKSPPYVKTKDSTCKFKQLIEESYGPSDDAFDPLPRKFAFSSPTSPDILFRPRIKYSEYVSPKHLRRVQTTAEGDAEELVLCSSVESEFKLEMKKPFSQNSTLTAVSHFDGTTCLRPQWTQAESRSADNSLSNISDLVYDPVTSPSQVSPTRPYEPKQSSHTASAIKWAGLESNEERKWKYLQCDDDELTCHRLDKFSLRSRCTLDTEEDSRTLKRNVVSPSGGGPSAYDADRMDRIDRNYLPPSPEQPFWKSLPGDSRLYATSFTPFPPRSPQRPKSIAIKLGLYPSSGEIYVSKNS